MEPQVAPLPDGRRWHFQHGPIDLIIDADGPGRDAALGAAADRFATVLDELVPELARLRTAADAAPVLHGDIARDMLAAVAPFVPEFVTPMAAVAGAVADTICSAMVRAGPLVRAYVNNGGDVALHLSGKSQFTAAVAAGLSDRLIVDSRSPVRGIATSGWRGRSQSLGIADAVTVLAETAARADAAATLIANRVDLPDSPKVTRVPAAELFADSDLGQRPVTVGVAPLDRSEIGAALARGVAYANRCHRRGLICGAHLTLGGQTRSIGAPPLMTHHEERANA